MLQRIRRAQEPPRHLSLDSGVRFDQPRGTAPAGAAVGDHQQDSSEQRPVDGAVVENEGADLPDSYKGEHSHSGGEQLTR